MIGVPPYSPGDYLDVEEDDDGGVTIRLADYFHRPLRLTPAEGLALLAAGRALLAVPGSDPNGPLATALAKLEARARAPGPRRRRRRARPPRRGPRRGRARTNASRSTTGRPAATSSRPAASIPRSCSSRSGEWYVGAYCHRAHDERMFRVDRIRAVRPTGEHFEPGATEFETGDVYRPRADDPRVTLELAPAAAWVAEAYPDRVGHRTRRRHARGRARGQRAGLARTAAAAARAGRPGRRPDRAPRRRPPRPRSDSAPVTARADGSEVDARVGRPDTERARTRMRGCTGGAVHRSRRPVQRRAGRARRSTRTRPRSERRAARRRPPKRRRSARPPGRRARVGDPHRRARSPSRC